MKFSVLWIFIAYQLIYVNNAYKIDLLDDLTSATDDTENVLEEIESPSQNYRNGKILWTFPGNLTEPFKKNGVNPTSEGSKLTERQKRFLLWSYPQSPLVDMIMQTMATNNYSPKNSHDPFDFLRDSYPLPKGKLTILYYLSLRPSCLCRSHLSDPVGIP